MSNLKIIRSVSLNNEDCDKVNSSFIRGSANIIRALNYSGWELPKDMPHPEYAFTKFCRTNKDVLNFYKKEFPYMYKNWNDDYIELFLKNNNISKSEISENFRDEFPNDMTWKEDFPNSFSPNEVHKILSYATNKWMGYEENDITWFDDNVSECRIIENIIDECPVICPIKFKEYNYIITIVGFEYDQRSNKIINYIIDGTCGKFNFKTMEYDINFTFGNGTSFIERETLLNMLKKSNINDNKYYAHFFCKGPLTL